MSLYSKYKSDFRQNLTLALPIMAGQLGQVLVNFIDNLMVGQLGPNALAAVSLAIAIYISFMIVGMGISYALPPLVAAAAGRNHHQGISSLFKHSLVINLGYALLCAILVEIGLPLLSHLGQDPEVVKLATPYLRLSGWTMIPLMLFQSLRCYADGMSETKPAMIASLIGNVFNVLFNYMFIYGKFGAPAMGVAGAALGTLFARSIMVILLVLILIKWKGIWKHIKNAKYFSYEISTIKHVLTIGIPTSMQMFFEVSAFAGAALIMGTLGPIPQAAHQIAINLAAMTFLTCTGFGIAATIRVGHFYGQENRKGVYDAGMSSILQVTFFMLVGAIIFILLRNVLPTMYINDPDVIALASGLLIVAGIFQVSDGVQVVAQGALRGIQDVKIPTLITFMAYWIFGLPFSYLSANYLGMGPTGVWIGLVIGLTISASLLTLRFRRLARKKNIKA